MSLAKLQEATIDRRLEEAEQELIRAHKIRLKRQAEVEKRGKMIQWRKHWARRRFHGVG